MTMSAELLESLRRLELIYLKHRGRKSGREYSTEISFAVDDEGVYLLANEESGRPPDWLLNMLAAGAAEFYAGTRLVRGRPEVLPDDAIPRLQEMFRARYGGEIVRRWYDAASVTPLRISDLIAS